MAIFPTPPRNRLRLIARLGALLSAMTGCMEVHIPDPNVTYIAFGDSSTDGPTNRDYPEILAEQLELSTDSIANEGAGGETAEDGLARLQGLFTGDIYPNAQVLLYWEGGNDLIDFVRSVDPLLLFSPNEADYPFRDQLNALLDDIHDQMANAVQAGKDAGLKVYIATYFPMPEDIVICNPLPIGIILPVQSERANHYVDLLNEEIRIVAFSKSAVLVDVADAGDDIATDQDNYYDCNHLSEAGNEIAAGVFREAIVAHSE